jgi:FxLD family lantipeptide
VDKLHQQEPPLSKEDSMSQNNAVSLQAGTDTTDEFDLDVRLVEKTDDLAGLIASTDDNCGSTCGACTTGVR